MADPSFFALLRLRILAGDHSVYDEQFRQGVNIIRGENGSGKSTIADFIFYILGGEFSDWKSAARRCDEVQAEVVTPRGRISLRRRVNVDTKIEPIFGFFATLATALEHPYESWMRLPIRRTERQDSFTQVMFRSAGIPESPSDTDSNITMHQVLRLLYSDQRTPPSRLFRFEAFDTPGIREAVGEMLCGRDTHGTYALRLELRDVQHQYEEKKSELRSIQRVWDTGNLPSSVALQTAISNLRMEHDQVVAAVGAVDQTVPTEDENEYERARRDAANALRRRRRDLTSLERNIEVASHELEDLERYAEFLTQLRQQLIVTERSSQLIGAIDFSHCPSCLSKLSDHVTPGHCLVCGSDVNEADEESKYLHIRIDLETQAKETGRLVEAKTLELQKAKRELRVLNGALLSQLGEYESRFDLSSSPREQYLAQRHQRLGEIRREIENLDEQVSVALKIEEITSEIATLQVRVEELKKRIHALETAGGTQIKRALSAVSSEAIRFLKRDLQRQVEFEDPGKVVVSFRDDAILVDDQLNFAESSNVILKNAAILSLCTAATHNSTFHHPCFVLLDNIEDKGMEPIRSHNFQSVIIDSVRQAERPFQIVMTTSQINPDLEVPELVIGSRYTHTNRSLNFHDQGETLPPSM